MLVAMSLSLNGAWALTYAPATDLPSPQPPAGAARIDASVPGNIELDLERSGRVPELFVGANITELARFEGMDFWYECEFDGPDGEHTRPVSLVFEGVDCIATYWLNGEEIGRSANAMIEHRFDVSDTLRRGAPNHLVVHIQSAIVAARRKTYEPIMRALPMNWAGLHIRKPAHAYGWDIMPRAVLGGIWRSVHLEETEACRFTDLYFTTNSVGEPGPDGRPGPATLSLFYAVATDPARLSQALVHVRGSCGDSSFDVSERAVFTAGSLSFAVEHPKLWWPRGYGEPNLYDVTVELVVDGAVAAASSAIVGIRTVALERSETTDPVGGGQFRFVVNGVPILVKGSNWVPADAFHSRDADRYGKLLDLFRDLGCSMLRCWGGNVYEDHGFYEFCDRNGIMVWQDFAMACARYPQDDEFAAELRAEAEAVVRKLRAHPALVVWCGDNECDQAWPDPSVNRLTREVLPDVVRRLDPDRPYIPSSPYYAPEVVRTGDRNRLPECHLWRPRDYYKSAMYTSHTAHFVGEIGYHGCPNVSSIRKFIRKERLWPPESNPEWMVHASDPLAGEGRWAYRIELMRKQVRELFGESPTSLDRFALASQICQAEAKKFFVEMTRLGKWRRTGVLWWNVVDGWPQFSDAVVDYYLGKKLAYHYLRRVQQPVCVMIGELADWHHRVVLGNDSRVDVRGRYSIRNAEDGAVVLAGEFFGPANENVELGRVPGSHAEHELYLIEWQSNPARGGSTTTVGGNHYLAGFPPIDLARYERWLCSIAELSPEFDAEAVAR